MIAKRDLIVVVFLTFYLSVMLFRILPISSQSARDYDPWYDFNDDGQIDMRDIGGVARKFGTSGDNITKSSLEYESDWINISNKAGEYFTVTHNLNITDLNNEDIILDITGKRTLNSRTLLRQLGLKDYWSQTYGGTGNDGAYSVIQTGDGGYAIAGETYSFGTANCDFWLVKTDALGNMQWNRTYGGIDNDLCVSIVQTSDDGFILAGSTFSFGAGDWDIWIVKVDEAGNMQWNKTYGGLDMDVVEYEKSIVQASDGGYVIAGTTYSFQGLEGSTLWLIKIDEYGNMQWNKTYGPWWLARSIIQTSDGGYAISGEPFLLVRTDSNGNVQWNKTYGMCSACSVVETSDGGYVLAGANINSDYDFWLVKTDGLGNMQWNRTYGGAYRDIPQSLVQTDDGGYIMAGRTDSVGAGDWDIWLVKTDSAGNMQWNKTYGGIEREFGFSVIKTIDGGYAIVGDTTSFGTGQCDVWLVRTGIGTESGLAWTDSAADSITLYRGATDPHWNYVRVRIWKTKEN